MALKKSQYNELVLKAAVTSVREGGKSLRDAARFYGVPRSTIQDRLRGTKPYNEVKKPVLTSSEEDRLVDWLTVSAKQGFVKTKAQVLTKVQTMLNDSNRKTLFKENRPGKTWYANFLKRHPDLSIRKPQALGSRRAAVTEEKVRKWFEIAHKEISSADADVLNNPSRIFNCDEMGFQLGGGIAKVLAKKTGKRKHPVTRNARLQITVLACGSASGDVLQPMLIFPGQRFSYDPMAGFPEAHFAKSPNGWIDSNIFKMWLETAFIPAVMDLDKPVLLLVDGNKTYVNLPISELCRDHSIILYQLPSHARDLVQPLDLTTFKALKQSWREEVLNYQKENCKTLRKKDFAELMKKAWTHGIKKDAVVSGFRAAGIYPWDPDHVDMTKLRPSRLFTETCQTETVTYDNLKEINLVPGMTVTDVQMTKDEEPPDDIVTEENTVIPLSPNISLNEDPPSPSPSPPAQPPLPSIPKKINTSDSEIAVSTSLFPFVTSTTVQQISYPNTNTPTTNDQPPDPTSIPLQHDTTPCFDIELTHLETLDRLIDLTSIAGPQKLIQYRTIHDSKTETNDVEARHFCALYSKLRRFIHDKTDNRHDECKKTQTFDNLSLSVQRSGKGMRTTFQPPKMVTSDAVRQFVTDAVNKKKRTDDEKENRTRDREGKRKTSEELKERKNISQEEKEIRSQDQVKKTKESEEKKTKVKGVKRKAQVKSKSITTKKQKKTSDTDTDSESLASITSSKCVEDDDDITIEDVDEPLIENVCFGCQGQKDGEISDWIGCECGRWFQFHKDCVFELLRGKSMHEIEQMTFVCQICEKKKMLHENK